MQSDGSTINQDLGNEDWQGELSKKYANHLQYFYKISGPFAVYNDEQQVLLEEQTTEPGVEKTEEGLYADTAYTLYVTFQDFYTNNTLVKYYSKVLSVNITTTASPADRYLGIPLSGSEEKPGKQVFIDLAKALSKATGFPLKQISISEDNLVTVATRRLEARRLAVSYEVLAQLSSDPSGTSTMTPTFVLE